jgi:hypothetical protein
LWATANCLIAPSSFLCRANGTSHSISLWFIFRLSQSMPRSYKFSCSLRFSSQNTLHFFFPHKCHIPHPSISAHHFKLLQIWWVKNLIVTAVYWIKMCEFFHIESATSMVPAVIEIVQR